MRNKKDEEILTLTDPGARPLNNLETPRLQDRRFRGVEEAAEKVQAWIKGDVILSPEDIDFYGLTPGKDYTPVTGQEGKAISDAEAMRKFRREVETYCDEIDALTAALRRSVAKRVG